MKKIYNTKKQIGVSFKALKKMLALGIIVASASLISAQNVDFSWAKKFGGGSNEQGKAIATDKDGNVYITGAFAGTADFDPSQGTTNLVSNGSFDVFVSKIDPAGNLVWAKGFGGNISDAGNAIAVDESGNVYTTGSFIGTVDFDPGAGTTNLASNGNRSIFISKLDASGNFVWAKAMGSTAQSEGFGISVDASGSVYTTGSFSGNVDFDPGTGTTLLTASAGTDIYISKLDASGNHIWAKSFGGSSSDRGLDIQLDDAGNIYTTGAFRGTGDFDPGAGTTTLTSVNGAQDIYVSKWDASGNFVWAKACGGTGDDVGHSLDVDASGNVYFTGEFSETADFNPGTANNNLNAYGSADAYVTKLNSSGNFVWTRQVGGTSLDRAYGLRLDRVGNVYITGEYLGTIDLDPGKGTDNYTSQGLTDIFIVKLSPSGGYDWGVSYGRNIEDKGFAIDVDHSGNVFFIGHFWVSIDFDPGPGTGWVNSSGGADVYVVKFECAPTTGVQEVVACNSYTFNGVTYTSNNNTATDTLVNSVGCDSIVTLNLTITNVDVSVTRTGNTLTANLSGAKYQWINCEKGPIIGENNASYTATKDGTYAVEITYKGCMDTSNCDTIGIMSVNDLQLREHSIALYPNPANAEVSISNFGDQVEQINITDVSGKLIRSFVPSSSVIDVSDLQQGMYMVQLQIGDRLLTRKLVKQ